MLDAGIVVGHLARDEVVHVLRTLLHQQDVLDEVGAGPAGGVARFHAQRPRRVAVGDHLLDQGIQLGPGGGHFVAVGFERHRAVPDDRLDVGLDGQPQPLATDGADGLPVGGVVLAVHAQRFHRLEQVLVLGELSHLPERDVGRGAGLDAGVEERLVTRGFRGQDDATGIHQRLQDLVQVLFLGARPLIEHGDLVTGLGAHAVDARRRRGRGRRLDRGRRGRRGFGATGGDDQRQRQHDTDDGPAFHVLLLLLIR